MLKCLYSVSSIFSHLYSVSSIENEIVYGSLLHSANTQFINVDIIALAEALKY